ncbi:MAG: hypothetical protein KDA05_07455 [Phycisphaerales bacterium]|nr:hypothetical protein [Phycisphaerales bacterium]MCB9840831.1 hypothetical protein [Phycisphaeraceae bacterium]
MNWLLVLLLSVPGALMGLLSVRGHTRGIEPYLWVVLGVFASLVVSRTSGGRVFLHGLAIGVAWGVLNGVVAGALFDTYARHNPEIVERFAARAGGPPARLMYLMAAPVVGLVTGLALGGMCWVASLAIRPVTPAA